MCKIEFKHDQKGNQNTKEKLSKRRGICQDASEKKNMAPHQKSKVVEKGCGSPLMEKQSKGSGRKPLKCWTCGGDHQKWDWP